MSAGAFSLVFVACLGVMLAARLWLSRRQIAHVRAHRAAVPPAFAGRIPDAAHAKAADYTVAKETQGEVETVVDALLLVVLTLGGGLALLLAWTERVDVAPLWRDVLLLAGVAVISGLVGLPFVYLGYWVQGSHKMDYKARFTPLELLRPDGWIRFDRD